MKYFAYGSNMLTGWLRQSSRAPSASPLGPGVLSNYEIRFHKRSVDGSGKCTVVACSGREVFGVVFEVDPDEKPDLDRAEGHGYTEENLLVSYECGALSVFTYVARPDCIDSNLAPYSWYREVVVAGAREHHLPEPYIRFLLATDATEDRNRARDEQHRRFLASLFPLGSSKA